MMRAYPTVEGRPVSPYELDTLPETQLDPTRYDNENNHHGAFYPRRLLARSALLSMVKNLETLQYRLPFDVHGELHELYLPPKIPTPQQAFNMIENEYEEEAGHFRTGSLHRPKFQPILRSHLDTAMRELRQLEGRRLY